MVYLNHSDFANCMNCGTFLCLSSGVHGIRGGEKSRTYFKAEYEMDETLRILKGRALPTERLFNPQSSYTQVRRPVVDWMCELCEVLKFQEETTHHAICLFDQFFSQQQNAVEVKNCFNGHSFAQIVQLIASTCILVSAKTLEKTYPAVDKLISIIQSPFLYDHFIHMEQKILETLDWNMNFTTTYDFVLHFLCQGILFSADQVMNKDRYIRANSKAAAYARKYCLFFADLCQQEQSFLQYDSLTLACGIVMAARKMIRIKEKWSMELEAMSAGLISLSRAKRCMHHIFEFYEETFPDHNLKATTDFSLKNSKASPVQQSS